MILGIEASNIRGGGGVTHLSELLKAANPAKYGIEQVILWSGLQTLRQIRDAPWLVKIHSPLLDRSLLHRIYWQRFLLEQEIQKAGCNILFVPGGTYQGKFRPFVAMSQNMLPFEWKEARRYGVSAATLRFLILRFSQLRTFQNADGTIFLTRYARNRICRILKRPIRTTLAPHGIDPRFRRAPRPQPPLHTFSFEHPLKILYVSPIAPYKHHWHVIEAVSHLRDEGYPVILEIVGPIRNAKRRFYRALARFDPEHKWATYHGSVPFSELHRIYHNADMFVFASTCENMPLILLEAMASGLPIVSSAQEPMPEVLQEAGIYFQNPQDPLDISAAIKKMLQSHDLRYQKAKEAYHRSLRFTWQRCADRTFRFIAETGQGTPVERSRV